MDSNVEKKKSNNSLLIVIGILIVLVGCFLTILCLNRGNDTKKATTNNDGNTPSTETDALTSNDVRNAIDKMQCILYTPYQRFSGVTKLTTDDLEDREILYFSNITSNLNKTISNAKALFNKTYTKESILKDDDLKYAVILSDDDIDFEQSYCQYNNMYHKIWNVEENDKIVSIYESVIYQKTESVEGVESSSKYYIIPFAAETDGVIPDEYLLNVQPVDIENNFENVDFLSKIGFTNKIYKWNFTKENGNLQFESIELTEQNV